MRTNALHTCRRRAASAGFTFIEMLIATAVGIVMLSGVMIIYFNGNQCFVAMTNYQNLDKYSCNALNILTREIRCASSLTSYTTNSLTLTNSTLGNQIQVTYNPSSSTLVLTETRNPALGSSAVTITNLVGCDTWSYSLYMGVPDTNSFGTNIVFYAATNAASTRIIQMNWRCSRTYLGSKLNTESVQMAQIVLRDKTVN